MANLTYSFLDVQCAIVGPALAAPLANSAGAAKEGLTINANGDINTMTIGADGSVMHSLKGDVSGTVTVRLLKTSPWNAVLNAAYLFQTASASSHGQNTITLFDAARGDSVTCQFVAFKKITDLTYSEEAGTNEWVFDAGKIVRTLAA